MVRIITALGATAALAATVGAADVTTEMFLVGFTSQAMVASVVTSDATATTFSVTCATDVSKCALPTSFTFTQGPSTMHFDYVHQPTASDDVTATVAVGCDITAEDHGTCSKTVYATLATITSTSTSATTTFTNGGSVLGGQVVTVTAGKLVVATTATSTSSSSTKSSSSSSSTSQPTSTATVPTSSSSTSSNSAASVSGTSSISSSSSIGAMPMITAPAHWVIGGAAAALAMAAL